MAAQKIVLSQPRTVLIYPVVLEDKLWLLWAAQAGKRRVVLNRKQVKLAKQQLYATILKFRQLLSQPNPSTLPQLQQFDGRQYLAEKYAISTILTTGLTDTNDKLSSNREENSVLAMGLSQPVLDFNPLPSALSNLKPGI